MCRKIQERAEAILARRVGFGEMMRSIFLRHSLSVRLRPITRCFCCWRMSPRSTTFPSPSIGSRAGRYGPARAAQISPNPPRLHANIAAFERLLFKSARQDRLGAFAWTTPLSHAGADAATAGGAPQSFMEIKLDPVDTARPRHTDECASGTIKRSG